MAKRKGTVETDTRATVEAKLEQRDMDVLSVLTKVKTARDESLKVVNSCRSVVKMSTFGEEFFTTKVSAEVAQTLDESIQRVSVVLASLKDAADTFAPYPS